MSEDSFAVGYGKWIHTIVDSERRAFVHYWHEECHLFSKQQAKGSTPKNRAYQYKCPEFSGPRGDLFRLRTVPRYAPLRNFGFFKEVGCQRDNACP